MTAVPRRLWQIAGALCLAHIVLILVGLALQQGPLFADGTEGIRDRYVEGDLVPHLHRRRARVRSGSWCWCRPSSSSAGSSAAAPRGAPGPPRPACCAASRFVAVTFAVGFPAGGAAMYGAQHGLDLDTAFALNNVRIFGYFLSLLLLGASTLGFAVAALADRVHPRWFGGFGVVDRGGAAGGTPLASLGQQDWGTLVWMVWFVGVGVLMLRHRDDAAPVA